VLYDALFKVLVEDKDEFVYLFMERVELKTFLSDQRLNELYNKVYSNIVHA